MVRTMLYKTKNCGMRKNVSTVVSQICTLFTGIMEEQKKELGWIENIVQTKMSKLVEMMTTLQQISRENGISTNFMGLFSFRL